MKYDRNIWLTMFEIFENVEKKMSERQTKAGNLEVF